MSELLASVDLMPSWCAKGEILLLTGDLDVCGDLENTSGERARAELMEEKSSLRFLAARRLLRRVISRLEGCHPGDVEVETNDGNKPFLPNSSWQFSIAHTAETVGVAISHEAIGLDLEHVRPLDQQGLARRFFSESEALLFDGKADSELFFTLWTCREAAIKADGRGLSSLLSVTRVHPNETGGDGLSMVTIGPDSWHALPWNEVSGLHGAVAFREIPSAISWCDLRGKGIL